MANNRATFAQAKASATPLSWPQASRQPSSTDGYSICTEDRYSVVILTAGIRLWFWHDLLEAVAAVAEGWCVGQARGSGQDRLVTSHCRQFFSKGCFWGAKTGPNPTDRRKLGSKHHVITDAQGVPLATRLTGAQAHDVTQLIPLVDAIPPVRGKPRRPRRKPDQVQGDRGYDSEPHRRQLRERRHQTGIGQTTNGTRQWLGSLSLGCRTYDLLVAPISPFAHSL